MSLGPITIFDKSALQALSLDEAVWFANFYLANSTPLFFVETLADLEKIDAKRRSSEQVHHRSAADSTAAAPWSVDGDERGRGRAPGMTSARIDESALPP